MDQAREEGGNIPDDECGDFTAIHEGDSQQSVQETSENCDELVVSSEVFRNTLAANTVIDGLDRMLHDVEPGFLSPRNLTKLE